MRYSLIVPVYNRPDEVDELLESLCSQTLKDFEVIIVEDGSQKPCKDVCDKYANILDLHYYYKENSGPGQSRNYGVERAHGDYVIILDSDVVLPTGYLAAVDNNVQCSMFRRSRRSPSLLYSSAEGHQLFHDVVLYDGRYPWWQEKARQILPTLVQYGYPS